MRIADLTTAGLIAGVAAIALFVAVRYMRAGAPSRTVIGFGAYGPSGYFATWFTPALVLLGANQVNLLGFAHWTLSAKVTFAFGLGFLSFLLTRFGFQLLRDLGFSILSIPVSIALLIQYIAQSPDTVSPGGRYIFPVAALLPLLVAFATGVFFNWLRLFKLPRLPISFLGALDVILFLISPSGQNLFLTNTPLPALLIVAIVAGLLGFAASAATDLILALSAIAIFIYDVGIQLYVANIHRSFTEFDAMPLIIMGSCIGGALVVAVGQGVFLRLLDLLRR